MRDSQRLRWALAGMLFIGSPTLLVAQDSSDNTSYGTTSAEFLLFGAGARGTALGGAFAAIATDVSALYYNPGGAALVTRPGAMISTYDYIADTQVVTAESSPNATLEGSRGF